MLIKVFYTDKQVVESKLSFGRFESPSARKPKQIAEALKSFANIEFVEPEPVLVEDFKLCHNEQYVDDIFSLKTQNGFGCISEEINNSLLYTNGAMVDAMQAAKVDSPTCALVAGFHHAGYNGWKNLGYFCTFNGLVLAALQAKKQIAIVDCDMHEGNGTQDILSWLPAPDSNKVVHITFGMYYHHRKDAVEYLDWLKPDGYVERKLKEAGVEAIIYQAGADPHVNDPYGGILTTEELYERDLRMFRIARRLNVPITWNLAGGYQIGEDGSIDKVIEIHLNTFKACLEVYMDL